MNRLALALIAAPIALVSLALFVVSDAPQAEKEVKARILDGLRSNGSFRATDLPLIDVRLVCLLGPYAFGAPEIERYSSTLNMQAAEKTLSELSVGPTREHVFVAYGDQAMAVRFKTSEASFLDQSGYVCTADPAAVLASRHPLRHAGAN